MIIKDQITIDNIDLPQAVIDSLGADGKLQTFPIWRDIANDHEFYQQLSYVENQFNALRNSTSSIEQGYRDQIQRTQYVDTLKFFDTHLSNIIDWANSTVVIDPYDGSIRPVARSLNPTPGKWLIAGQVTFEDEKTIIGQGLTKITFTSPNANYLGFYITNVDQLIINGVLKDVNRGVSVDFIDSVSIEIPERFSNKKIALENILFSRIAYQKFSVIQTTQLSETYRVPNKIIVPDVDKVFWEFSVDGSTWYEDSTIVKDSSDRPYVHEVGEIGSSVVLSTTLGGDPISSILSLTSGVQTPVAGEYSAPHWILPETLRLYRDIDTWLITDTMSGGYDLVDEDNNLIQELGGFYFTAGHGRVRMTVDEINNENDPRWIKLLERRSEQELSITELRSELSGLVLSATGRVNAVDRFNWENVLKRMDNWLEIVRSNLTDNRGRTNQDAIRVNTLKHKYLSENPFTADSFLKLKTEDFTLDDTNKNVWSESHLDLPINGWVGHSNQWKINYIVSQREIVNRIIDEYNAEIRSSQESLANSSIQNQISNRNKVINQINTEIAHLEKIFWKEIELPLNKDLFDRMLLGNETDNLQEDLNTINGLLSNAGVTVKEASELRKYILYMNGQDLLDNNNYQGFIDAEQRLIQHFQSFGAIATLGPSSSGLAESIGKVQTNFHANSATNITLAIASDLFKIDPDNNIAQNVIHINHNNSGQTLIPSSSQIEAGISYDIFNIDLLEGRNYIWFLSTKTATHEIADYLNIKLVLEGVFYPFTLERAGLIASPFPPSKALDYKTWLNYTEEHRKFEVVGLDNFYNHADSAWQTKIYISSPLGFPYEDRAMSLTYNYRDDAPSAITTTSAPFYIRGTLRSDNSIATRINNFSIGYEF